MTDTLDLTDVDLWRDLHMDDELECNSRTEHVCSVEATWLRIACDAEEIFWCDVRKKKFDRERGMGWTCVACFNRGFCGHIRPI